MSTTESDAPEADTLAARHVALAERDLAAGRASTAASRTLRIAAEDIRKAMALLPPIEPQREKIEKRRQRCPCPCALGGLWRGVPRARRRHARLCSLWAPPPSEQPRYDLYPGVSCRRTRS